MVRSLARDGRWRAARRAHRRTAFVAGELEGGNHEKLRGGKFGIQPCFDRAIRWRVGSGASPSWKSRQSSAGRSFGIRTRLRSWNGAQPRPSGKLCADHLSDASRLPLFFRQGRMERSHFRRGTEHQEPELASDHRGKVVEGAFPAYPYWHTG